MSSTADVQNWLWAVGRRVEQQVDRLWPHENDPGYRGQCLAEEAGEVNRAITKRRHAQHAFDGKCKGLTHDQWTTELETELAQVVAVALDIACREGFFTFADRILASVEALEQREPGT